ncbi:hypothetical protein L21SP5_02799 [Salinivirga cyanobacteriivorans]|uniref:Uncharacterized protein n=1 Tax=Salinivirga cyanobacteriivorans TaxID=1307839 RepID=A0A0S2I2B8_9BACT|nr:hypothetical protein L21SP5_02799 [Salinivirga cyanobacteriivorans]
MSSIAKPLSVFYTIIWLPDVLNKLNLLFKRLLLSLFALFITRLVFIAANDSVFASTLLKSIFGCLLEAPIMILL